MALQLTPALEQRLEHLAAESHSSLDELAREALEEFCATREELIAAVKESDEEFERGEFFTHEEVRSHIEEILASR